MKNDMKRKKILIIDDEEDFCLILKSYFTGKQYEVYYSYSLNKGMKLLDEIEPDIVFLDNHLPDGSGWSKADQIMKQHPLLQLNLMSTFEYDYPKKEIPSLRFWEKPLQLTELGKIF